MKLHLFQVLCYTIQCHIFPLKLEHCHLHIKLLALSNSIEIKKLFLFIHNFSSKFSRPGYELHYVVDYLASCYVVNVLVCVDLCFFYLTFYLAFRLDIFIYLSTHLGTTGTNSNYRTDERQSKLLRKMIKLHIDIFR